MLLIDNDITQFLELHSFLDQCMRSDYEIDLAPIVCLRRSPAYPNDEYRKSASSTRKFNGAQSSEMLR